ncbi:MAG: ribonuclease catalytic domain-containing protein [bacterium]|nr:ribonuclease catalytic domain-containing protein [bacterium]
MGPNYCLFYKGGRLAFGLITDFKKNKWVVLPDQGKEVHLNKGQTALTFSGASFANEAEGLEILSQKIPWVEAQARELDLKTFHELLDKGQPYTIEELAELLLDEPGNGWMMAALYLALKDETYLFHQKKTDFFARSEEEIELLKAKESREAEAAAQAERERQWAATLRQGELPLLEPTEQATWDKFIGRLRNFLFFWEHNPEAEHFAQLFELNLRGGLYDERRVIEALNLSGDPISWGRLLIEREGVAEGFTPEELAAAEALAQADPFTNAFGLETRDLRHLGGHSIDNESTQDYDDAFSLELEGEDLILWVHIAEVASYLPPDNLLFSKAWDRAASLYSPLRTFPMLPPVLSERFLSLNAGEDHAAVSFRFRFDAQSKLVESDYCRSVVHLEGNWTYGQCNELLEAGTGLWPRLEAVSERLLARRLENGALELDRAEVRFETQDLAHLVLIEESRETRAHKLVQELAILVNGQAGDWAAASGQPNLFRNQEPYSFNRPMEPGEKPRLQDLNIRPAAVGLQAQGHAALGLDAYLQCTSPIRRFLDLVSQRLLLENLAERAPSFTPDQLSRWAVDAEARVKRLGQLERRLWEHLKYRYLAQNADEIYEAELFKELRGGRSLLLLPKLDLKLPTRSEGLEEGRVYQVKILEVDPAYEEVRFELVDLQQPTSEEE